MHLANTLANELRMTKLQAKQFADLFFELLAEAVINGERIEARGFGVLSVKQTKAKPNARNPRTGEIVSVPARRKVHFKAGKLLREELKRPLEASGSDILDSENVSKEMTARESS